MQEVFIGNEEVAGLEDLVKRSKNGMNAVKVIILAHNEYDLVMMQLDILIKLSGLLYENIIIVDNDSDDELKNWLIQQDFINYIICDEKLESYADIFNKVMDEFIIDEDILLLKPELFLLPDTMEDLQAILYSGSNIGAVYPERINSWECVKWNSFEEAISYARQRKNEEACSEEVLALTDGVMISNKMLKEIGEADNTLSLPNNVLTDLAFRGIQSGYRYLKAKNVYLYQIASCSWIYEEIYAPDIDQNRLKEKWKMKYFNGTPNWDILSYVHEKKDVAINVLEIGCDCGINLLRIKNKYQNSALYGVEINPVAAGIASHYAKVIVGDIESLALEFGDIQFDYIIFGGVLEHLKNPARVIYYCRKLLKPFGKILASISNLMNYAIIYDLLNGNFSYSDAGLLNRTHIHFFTYNEIVKMFQEEGYDIEKIDYVVTKYYQEKERDFVGKLLEVSKSAKEFMFAACQFIVIAAMDIRNSFTQLCEYIESERIKIEEFPFRDVLHRVRLEISKKAEGELGRIENYTDIYSVLLAVAIGDGDGHRVISVLKHFIRDVHDGKNALSDGNIRQLEAMKDEALINWTTSYAKRAYEKYRFHSKKNENIFRGRGVIYTVLTGNYDSLNEPQIVDNCFDYICFTDNYNLQSDVWNIKVLDNHEHLDMARLSRKPKILCHKYLKEYDYSVYIDAKMIIVGDMRAYIKKYSKGNTMLCFPHYIRNCAYEEAQACIDNKKDDPEIIEKQMQEYRSEGFPADYGMIDAACMVRLHNDPALCKAMEEWWEEVKNKSRRDQLSIEYVCWKNEYHYDLCDLVLKYNEYIRDNREGANPY